MSTPEIPWGYLQANLDTLAGIARRFNITRATATIWSQEVGFPAAVLTFSAHSGPGVTRYYWVPDVRTWIDKNGKGHRTGKRGRPAGRNAARDAEIIARSATETNQDLAAAYGLSYQRVRQIVTGTR